MTQSGPWSIPGGLKEKRGACGRVLSGPTTCLVPQWELDLMAAPQPCCAQVREEYDTHYTLEPLPVAGYPQVRFCRYRFSPTGELGYRGARRVRTQVHCMSGPFLLIIRF
jgi:hypothetical protein